MAPTNAALHSPLTSLGAGMTNSTSMQMGDKRLGLLYLLVKLQVVCIVKKTVQCIIPHNERVCSTSLQYTASNSVYAA